MTAQWIGPDDSLTVGQIGFLIERSNTLKSTSRFEVRDTPAHTNQSHKPRLHGWCGSWNDVATHARGVVRVERIAKNGRAYVRQLEGQALLDACESFGYPDLAPTTVS